MGVFEVAHYYPDDSQEDPLPVLGSSDRRCFTATACDVEEVIQGRSQGLDRGCNCIRSLNVGHVLRKQRDHTFETSAQSRVCFGSVRDLGVLVMAVVGVAREIDIVR